MKALKYFFFREHFHKTRQQRFGICLFVFWPYISRLIIPSTLYSLQFPVSNSLFGSTSLLSGPSTRLFLQCLVSAVTYRIHCLFLAFQVAPIRILIVLLYSRFGTVQQTFSQALCSALFGCLCYSAKLLAWSIYMALYSLIVGFFLQLLCIEQVLAANLHQFFQLVS